MTHATFIPKLNDVSDRLVSLLEDICENPELSRVLYESQAKGYPSFVHEASRLVAVMEGFSKLLSKEKP